MDFEIDRIEGNLPAVLKNLKNLKKQIDDKESDLKTIKSEFTKLESLASKLMEQDEIDKITIAGAEFTPALPAFKIINEQPAFQWLDDNGFGEAIKQSKATINHQTLSKLLRERLEQHGIESIPPELFECVNTGKLKIKTS